MKYNVIDVDASSLQEKYKIGLLSAKLLKASHLDDEEVSELFATDTTLTTSKADCIQKCCKRLLQARDNNEKVMIAGDYDADGICSTTIMKMTLMKLKIEHGYYIPDRMKEGYGLSAHTVELAHQKGYSLIITVDNGVKAHAAIQKANELGLDIINTDHHQIDEEIKTPYVVHP
ncbi:MAG: DHH family phosphoesterase, partial [Solobacterium sp.]|nr:DHH family phosphoesterase [Solobacterium sp.]